MERKTLWKTLLTATSHPALFRVLLKTLVGSAVRAVYFLICYERRRGVSVSASTRSVSAVIRLSCTSCSYRISIRRASIRARRLETGWTTAATMG
jgi:hypothetical protein